MGPATRPTRSSQIAGHSPAFGSRRFRGRNATKGRCASLPGVAASQHVLTKSRDRCRRPEGIPTSRGIVREALVRCSRTSIGTGRAWAGEREWHRAPSSKTPECRGSSLAIPEAIIGEAGRCCNSSTRRLGESSRSGPVHCAERGRLCPSGRSHRGASLYLWT